MKYIYGPLESRRLGFSLGVSLIPYKTCSFDCVYCQLGRTREKTRQRKEYISGEEILKELRTYLQANSSEAQNLNYITLSGSGEPTLNIQIGQLIAEIKKITRIPLAVITNSSLLVSASVRAALLEADLIVPSLDAIRGDIFEKIDRPDRDIKIENIIAGLIDLRKEFRGRIWLEVMLVKGLNDDIRQIKKFKEVIDKINPDKIQLNSPVRSTAEPNILAVNRAKLKKIKDIFGDKCEIL